MRRSAKGSTRPTSKAPMLALNVPRSRARSCRESCVSRGFVDGNALLGCKDPLNSLNQSCTFGAATRLLTGNLPCLVKFALESAVRQIPRIRGKYRWCPIRGIKKSRACATIRTLVFGLH